MPSLIIYHFDLQHNMCSVWWVSMIFRAVDGLVATFFALSVLAMYLVSVDCSGVSNTLLEEVHVYVEHMLRYMYILSL